MSTTKKMTVKSVMWVDHPNFIPPCTASAARKEMKKLRNEHGQVAARDVWKSQQDSDAPMHGYFEWDDAEAADKHRDSQARLLLGSLRVEYHQTDEPQQLMVRTRIGRSRGYEELQDALMDEDKALVSLEDAKALVSKVAKRIKHLERAKEVVAQMQIFAAKQ